MHAARSASVEIVGVKIAETRTYWKLPWSVIDRIDYNNKLMKNACNRRVSAATILTSMHNNHTQPIHMTAVMPAVSYITENVALFHPFGHTPRGHIVINCR